MSEIDLNQLPAGDPARIYHDAKRAKKARQLAARKGRMRHYDITRVAYASLREELTRTGWSRPETAYPKGLSDWLRFLCDAYVPNPAAFADARPIVLQDLDWPRSRANLPLLWLPADVPKPDALKALPPPPDYDEDQAAWHRAIDALPEDSEVVASAWEFRKGTYKDFVAHQEFVYDLKALMEEEGLPIRKIPKPPSKRIKITPMLTDDHVRALADLATQFHIPPPFERNAIEVLCVGWLSHPQVPPPLSGPRKPKGRKVKILE